MASLLRWGCTWSLNRLLASTEGVESDPSLFCCGTCIVGRRDRKSEDFSCA